MGLKEHIEKDDSSKRGGRCTVDRLLDALPDKERAELEALIDDPTVEASRLCRAIEAEYDNQFGIVKQWSLGRHRRRDCRCR